MSQPSKLAHLIERAKDVDKGYAYTTINWEELGVTEDQSYVLIGESVLDHWKHIDIENPDNLLLLASMTHLLVENMVLQLELLRRDDEE
jgi:hypothetical protein